MSTPSLPAAADPERYPDASAIRSYLEGTTDLLGAAVHERWPVKTGCDPDAEALTGQTPTSSTVEELTTLPVPTLLPPNGRADGAEKTLYEVQATLTAYRAEKDGDYHIVISDRHGRTMIAEIPKPGDITGLSYFASEIAEARAAFDEYFKIAESPAKATAPNEPLLPLRRASVPVAVTGLGFFDFAHGQIGVAPNAIELHPVVRIEFQA